jgi:hypothetical protein
MIEERIEFENKGEKIIGLLESPETKTSDLILLAHGFTGSMDGPSNLYKRLTSKLVESGFTVYRFNFRFTSDPFENHHVAIIENDILLAMIGAAFIDSINPCAIGVLLILLNILLFNYSRKATLKVALSFIFSIYLWYFLFGLGLFAVVRLSGLSFLFYRVVGAVTIVVGLANIKDYF